MANTQYHRGQHSNDKKLFGKKFLEPLNQAVDDFSLLLSRNYSEKAALKLVGDHYKLNNRQRLAIRRCGCAEESVERRKKTELSVNRISNKLVYIDGYNQLISIECALSGGLLFFGKDGCYRDIASVHGTYRKVQETIPAIHLIGKCLKELKVKKAFWYFDSPVSNSGRLKTILYKEAEKFNWNWEINLLFNPDKTLVEKNEFIISSDSWILDRVKSWVNFLDYVIKKKIPSANIIELR